MAIAGAVIVPVQRQLGELLEKKLSALQGVEVKGIGPNGLAAIMEAPDTRGLQKMTEDIAGWEEVIDISIGYINWEGEENSPT